MDGAAFEPENQLERAIVRAGADPATTPDMLALATQFPLWVPSRGAVGADGNSFEPLVFDQGGTPYVAAFTAMSRPAVVRHAAAYVIEMKGRAFFARLPAGFGVVLNPGFAAEFVIAPAVASEIKAALTPPAAQ